MGMRIGTCAQDEHQGLGGRGEERHGCCVSGERGVYHDEQQPATGWDCAPD